MGKGRRPIAKFLKDRVAARKFSFASTIVRSIDRHYGELKVIVD
jgi:hypothetical protein